MDKRNYVIRVREDLLVVADNPPVYSHTFTDIESAMAALWELHRDYARGNWSIEFRSYPTR